MYTPSKGLGPGDTPEAEDPSVRETEIDVDALVLRARAGDLRAQGELVVLYRPRLRGFLRLRVQPAHEIDDVLQVIWTKMAVRIRDLRDHQLFETWLFTLARNACFDRLRRIRV
ncbi:MAG: RNA polymerase sigma factor, partial [Opitutaceae bacterium]